MIKTTYKSKWQNCYPIKSSQFYLHSRINYNSHPKLKKKRTWEWFNYYVPRNQKENTKKKKFTTKFLLNSTWFLVRGGFAAAQSRRNVSIPPVTNLHRLLFPFDTIKRTRSATRRCGDESRLLFPCHDDREQLVDNHRWVRRLSSGFYVSVITRRVIGLRLWQKGVELPIGAS